MWSLRIVLRLPSPERLAKGGQVEIAVVALPELPADRAVAALDRVNS